MPESCEVHWCPAKFDLVIGRSKAISYFLHVTCQAWDGLGQGWKVKGRGGSSVRGYDDRWVCNEDPICGQSWVWGEEWRRGGMFTQGDLPTLQHSDSLDVAFLRLSYDRAHPFLHSNHSKINAVNFWGNGTWLRWTHWCLTHPPPVWKYTFLLNPCMHRVGLENCSLELWILWYFWKQHKSKPSIHKSFDCKLQAEFS